MHDLDACFHSEPLPREVTHFSITTLNMQFTFNRVVSLLNNQISWEILKGPSKLRTPFSVKIPLAYVDILHCVSTGTTLFIQPHKSDLPPPLSGTKVFLWGVVKTIFYLVTKCQVCMMGEMGIRGLISKVAARVCLSLIAVVSNQADYAQHHKKPLENTIPK